VTRSEFIIHLIDQDCYPDEECDSEVGQLWHCGISGQSCYVPYVDELAVPTWCHIVYELRIDPPHKYDAFYHVYLSWRDVQYKNA
jgi:hypothetical protein